ncbi:MAG: Smr/MutS family protein [Oscillospiraceae bacterium]|nr:Smr/MutS family protein [Oscillospiraceae bacterium]MBQ9939662.1 Smr/MutS family protein [Oscillospiraceae bacterium]
MPTADAALKMLSQAIRTAKAGGCTVVKVIHGYGSSGRGGAIRSAVARELSARKLAGTVKDWVRGEDFSPFDPSSRRIIEACPDISYDRDFAKANHGISIILL